jgi:hypothetical protein
VGNLFSIYTQTMSPVQRLGGQHCAYYLRGRCTRTIGQDQSVATRCGLLEARRRLGAQTMDRLERLQRLADPDDREIARRHLIQKNVEAISHLSCPGLVPPPQGGHAMHPPASSLLRAQAARLREPLRELPAPA